MKYYPHKFNHTKFSLVIYNFSEGTWAESLKIQWCSVCQNTGAAVRSEHKGQQAKMQHPGM